jgi:hypothetical protein
MAKHRRYYTCRACGYRIRWPVDICAECREDFGESGEDENGVNCTCVHCGSNEYDRCCPKCRQPLKEEEWERIEDRILADAEAERAEKPKEARHVY